MSTVHNHTQTCHSSSLQRKARHRTLRAPGYSLQGRNHAAVWPAVRRFWDDEAKGRCSTVSILWPWSLTWPHSRAESHCGWTSPQTRARPAPINLPKAREHFLRLATRARRDCKNQEQMGPGPPHTPQLSEASQELLDKIDPPEEHPSHALIASQIPEHETEPNWPRAQKTVASHHDRQLHHCTRRSDIEPCCELCLNCIATQQPARTTPGKALSRKPHLRLAHWQRKKVSRFPVFSRHLKIGLRCPVQRRPTRRTHPHI